MTETSVTMSERALDGVLVVITTGSRSRSEYRHDTPKCTADVGQHGRDVLVAFAGQEPMAATAPKCGKCCKPLTFLGPQSDSS